MDIKQAISHPLFERKWKMIMSVYLKIYNFEGIINKSYINFIIWFYISDEWTDKYTYS